MNYLNEKFFCFNKFSMHLHLIITNKLIINKINNYKFQTDICIYLKKQIIFI